MLYPVVEYPENEVSAERVTLHPEWTSLPGEVSSPVSSPTSASTMDQLAYSPFLKKNGSQPKAKPASKAKAKTAPAEEQDAGGIIKAGGAATKTPQVSKKVSLCCEPGEASAS